MPLNAEVSFTWVGHGTWKVRSAKCQVLVRRPSALQKLVGSGVNVLDIKPGDIV